MIKYFENTGDITQFVEIDLKGISEQERDCLRKKVNDIDIENRKVFRFDAGNTDKLLYATELLVPTPKVNRKRVNLLLVIGNPAIHSVADGMFYSYQRTRNERKYKEHRFWEALRDARILRFNNEAIEEPTPTDLFDEIKRYEINTYKRRCLLNGTYTSDFNVFILPYFSFPTPASGKYNGVAGIRGIVGQNIFTEMKQFEAQRFGKIVKSYEIKNLICFCKPAWEEIKSLECKPVYVGPVKLILSAKAKDELKRIVSCMAA